jgi:hypothetical protein
MGSSSPSSTGGSASTPSTAPTGSTTVPDVPGGEA